MQASAPAFFIDKDNRPVLNFKYMSREQVIENLAEEMRGLYESGKYYVSLPKVEGKDYEGTYWDTIVDPDGTKRKRQEERGQFLNDVDYIIGYLKARTSGKILDIGCGLGWLLSTLSPEWEKHGIEVSKTAAEFSKKYGEIFQGSLSEANYPDGYFDVVVMHHVIEHLEKPEEDIKIIKRMLKNGGVFIVGTPDFDSGCARLFGKNYRLLYDQTHISLFSNDSIHRLLRDNGFNIFRTEYPFFSTRFFSKENLLALFDTNKISPPFHGNFMTFFCRNHKDT